VSKDGFVRVAGADYSLPPGLAGRRVQVRLSPTKVVVFLDGAVLAHHPAASCPPMWSWRPGMPGRCWSPARHDVASRRPMSPSPPSTWAATTQPSRSSHDRHGVRAGLLGPGHESPRIVVCAEPLARRAEEQGWDHQAYLAAVLAEEVAARETHGGEHRVKAARFPRSRRWTTSISPSSAR
jgi:hypothetical protein